MENTKMYVVAEVGYEALFEAIVAQAEADIQTGKKKIEIANKREAIAPNHNMKYVEMVRKNGEAMVNEATEGLAEWLKLLKTLDIADAIIR